MTALDRLETALRSSEPGRAVRAVVEDLAREGNSKAHLQDFFERVLMQVRTRPDFREAEEDAVLDVLDALTGWCHPGAELLREKPGG